MNGHLGTGIGQDVNTETVLESAYIDQMRDAFFCSNQTLCKRRHTTSKKQQH